MQTRGRPGGFPLLHVNIVRAQIMRLCFVQVTLRKAEKGSDGEDTRDAQKAGDETAATTRL
ncbi:MAG TPA: hypothetical protein VKR59_13175 [Terriglobales bacterium]|nr:hypothetical protein [Terriglobales bacterium]